MVEGTDSFSNIIGSVYYPDGETAKDLAIELVENVWLIIYPYNFLLSMHGTRHHHILTLSCCI